MTAECELGNYIAGHSRIINDTAFSSKLQNLFWFPDKKVSTGDLVVLYTKRGENNVAVNEDGSNTHFYYWGLDSSISSNERNCIVVLDASWEVIEVPIKPQEDTQ